MDTRLTNSAGQTELSLENVSVSFPIYHGGSRSLKKSLLFRGSGGQLGSDASHRITVEALRNVSLKFQTGDRVALIGTTDDKSASSGNFVGTVDGLEVFRKSCLGCKV